MIDAWILACNGTMRAETMSYTDSYINRTDEGDGVLAFSLPRTMRILEKMLTPVLSEFDVIVVSGLSGIVPGAIFAHEYGKQLVVIRKDDDVCHGTRIEGYDFFKAGTPYIILDDFISSGDTMRRIMTTMLDLDFGLPKYAAIYRGYWYDVRLPDGDLVVGLAVPCSELYKLKLVKEEKK